LRIVRYCFLAAAAVGAVIVVLLALAEHENSREVPFPSDDELRSGLALTTGWIMAHREQLLREENSMLWLFVRDAGRVTRDPRLLELANTFQMQHTGEELILSFFDDSHLDRDRTASILLPESWQDYQRLFVYGNTCNAGVGIDPSVVALLDPAACDRQLMWLRSPWCATHQLMGLRFVLHNHCEPDTPTRESIRIVQERILRELAWDFRVEDGYLQRVMTLVESGRQRDIKAVWVRRILRAQRADGGWNGIQVILRLPAGRILYWGAGKLYPQVMQDPDSNFHATAQGLYLLAMLSNRG
jgi:hypothetical protein